MDAKQIIRNKLVEIGGGLLGIGYEMAVEWKDHTARPNKLDCSEATEGIYAVTINDLILGIRRLPDGSQAQFNFTIPTDSPLPGDLAFFGRKKDPKQVYHVGMVYDDKNILEARAFDGRDWTGKVVLRERKYWEAYSNFLGYRKHPDLV